MDNTPPNQVTDSIPAVYALCMALAGASGENLCRRAFVRALATRRPSSDSFDVVVSREAVALWKSDRRDPARAKGKRDPARDSVLNALDTIDSDDAAFLIIRDMLGRSEEECAKILEISGSNVRPRLARAREQLRVARHRVEGRLV